MEMLPACWEAGHNESLICRASKSVAPRGEELFRKPQIGKSLGHPDFEAWVMENPMQILRTRAGDSSGHGLIASIWGVQLPGWEREQGAHHATPSMPMINQGVTMLSSVHNTLQKLHRDQGRSPGHNGSNGYQAKAE